MKNAHRKSMSVCQKAFNVVGMKRLIDTYCQHHSECDCVELLDDKCQCGLLQLLCSLGYPGASLPKELLRSRR